MAFINLICSRVIGVRNLLYELIPFDDCNEPVGDKCPFEVILLKDNF